MRICSLLSALTMIALPLCAQSDRAYVQAEPSGQDWTVGNRHVKRRITYSARHGLYTVSWRHLVSGTEFIPPSPSGQPGSEEFSFQVNGVRLTGSTTGGTAAFDLVGVEERELAPQGKVLQVKLAAKKLPIEVSVFYAVHDKHPVIRKWLAITNRGTAPLTLTHLAFEAVNLRTGPPHVQQVFGFYGIHPREIFFTGRAEDAAIVSRNSSSGEGFVVMNEAPGWLKRTEMAGWGNGVKVMYDTDIFPFERSLKAGETFTTAKSSLAFFAEGRGLSDPRWAMPSYTSQILMRSGASYQPPWIYNNYEPFYGEVDAVATHELIPIAARLGFDIFTLDYGWQDHFGDIKIHPKRFPNGLEPVLEALEQSGQRLGLWEPLAAVSEKSTVYREHPEWVCRDLHGQPKLTYTDAGMQYVMCLASPYREVAARRINNLIARYHLKYVKVDLTTVFNTYGEAPGCSTEGHYHGNWVESLAGIYEGMEYVTAEIYRRHPEVLLDLTFELWGQKHVIDYGLLANGDLDWLSNVHDSTPESAGPRQARTLLYHRSLAIPVETMLIGNLRAPTPTLEERFATAIGSGPLLLGDLRKLTLQEQDWYHEKIQWFKKLRREVPLNEGFFPLGSWMQPGASTWDGFARLSRKGEGIIVLFKNESGQQKIEIRLPAFPDGLFKVRSVMTGTYVGSYQGTSFQRGLPIALSSEHKVEILEIRK